MTRLQQHPQVVPDAWTTLWEQHHGEVVRYAAHLLGGDLHAAEDVAQETAVRLWQRRDSLRTDQPLGPWLRTVVRHIVVDHHRRLRARPAEVALGGEVDRPTPDTAAEIEARESVEEILAGLSSGHRAAVLEVYVNDRAVRDAAARLGIPAGTIKSRCHTALRQLREQTSTRCA